MSEACAGLYVHVPFCARVCPYCDFAVRTGGPERHRAYVELLCAEIDLYADEPLRFDTIYFGGGTPSNIAPELLGRLLEAIRARLDVVPEARLYLEANPEDVNASSLRAWRDLGVDTLSLGIQALNDAALAFLGRAHGAAQARAAVRQSREAAFRTVSIDLIYGLPGQSAGEWTAEMDRALALRPDHVSCYQLTIHPGTRFGAAARRGALTPLPDDRQADLFRVTHRHLEARGLAGYEVSQFAAAVEHRSLHNQKYWDHVPYLGLGPAAHSFRGRRRWWNHRRTSAWGRALEAGERPVEGEELLDGPALALEALMTGLRRHAGVDLGKVGRLAGTDVRARNAGLLNRLADEALITLAGDRLVPTLDGLAVADSLAALFALDGAGEGPAARAASTEAAVPSAAVGRAGLPRRERE